MNIHAAGDQLSLFVAETDHVEALAIVPGSPTGNIETVAAQDDPIIHAISIVDRSCGGSAVDKLLDWLLWGFGYLKEEPPLPHAFASRQSRRRGWLRILVGKERLRKGPVAA